MRVKVIAILHCLQVYVQACELLGIFLKMLSCSHNFLVRLLKGKLGKRSGHLLITCSLLVNYLSYLFDLWKEPTSQGKYPVIKKFEKYASMGVPGSRLVIRQRNHPQRTLSCQKLLTPSFSVNTNLKELSPSLDCICKTYKS